MTFTIEDNRPGEYQQPHSLGEFRTRAENAFYFSKIPAKYENTFSLEKAKELIAYLGPIIARWDAQKESFEQEERAKAAKAEKVEREANLIANCGYKVGDWATWEGRGPFEIVNIDIDNFLPNPRYVRVWQRGIFESTSETWTPSTHPALGPAVPKPVKGRYGAGAPKALLGKVYYPVRDLKTDSEFALFGNPTDASIAIEKLNAEVK